MTEIWCLRILEFVHTEYLTVICNANFLVHSFDASKS